MFQYALESSWREESSYSGLNMVPCLLLGCPQEAMSHCPPVQRHKVPDVALNSWRTPCNLIDVYATMLNLVGMRPFGWTIIANHLEWLKASLGIAQSPLTIFFSCGRWLTHLTHSNSHGTHSSRIWIWEEAEIKCDTYWWVYVLRISHRIQVYWSPSDLDDSHVIWTIRWGRWMNTYSDLDTFWVIADSVWLSL
jgi:hypothetical protein